MTEMTEMAEITEKTEKAGTFRITPGLTKKRPGSKRAVAGLLIPVCLWMALIFMFSDQEGRDSTVLSNRVLVRLGIVDQKHLEEAYYSPEVKWLRTAVRKLAHMALYSILGLMLLLIFKKGLGLSNTRAIMAALMVVMLYAVFDEWHQGLVPGRCSTLWDVGWDLIGAGIGIALYLGFTLALQATGKASQ